MGTASPPSKGGPWGRSHPFPRITSSLVGGKTEPRFTAQVSVPAAVQWTGTCLGLKTQSSGQQWKAPWSRVWGAEEGPWWRQCRTIHRDTAGPSQGSSADPHSLHPSTAATRVHGQLSQPPPSFPLMVQFLVSTQANLPSPGRVFFPPAMWNRNTVL